jgi:anti-repressor protein
MNSIVKITENIMIEEIIYNGKRMLTSKQLASIYDTELKNIQYNFKYHENKFIEGKHYIKLSGNELKEFKDLPGISRLVSKNTPTLVLWCEEGAVLMAKTINTDQAWEVSHKLVNFYFENKDQKQIPENLSKLEILKMALESEEKRIKLEEENKKLLPKAEFYDAVTQSENWTSIGKVSKILSIKNLGRNNLFKKLRELGLLSPENEPYQPGIEAGYFKVIEEPYEKSDGSVDIYYKTVVSQKGIDYILKKLKEQ